MPYEWPLSLRGVKAPRFSVVLFVIVPHCGGYSFRLLIWSGFATENDGFSLPCGVRERVRMRDPVYLLCLASMLRHRVSLEDYAQGYVDYSIHLGSFVTAGVLDLLVQRTFPFNVSFGITISITVHAPRMQIFDGESSTCCEVENVFTAKIGKCFEEAHVHKRNVFIHLNVT
jgi:hypothetical protein